MVRKAGGMFRVQVQGDKQLLRKLERLGRTEANKIIRQGLRAGAKTLQAETKRLAPVGVDKKGHKKGTLKRSIKVRALKRKRGRIGVGVTIGEGFFQGEAFYGAFVALGHKLGKRSRGLKRAAARVARFSNKDFSAVWSRGMRKKLKARLAHSKSVLAGDARKQIPPNEFMKQAAKNKESQMRSEFNQFVTRGIESAMAGK